MPTVRIEFAIPPDAQLLTRLLTRGLGLATATTSAAFFPHCEQRIRGASASRVVDQPTKRAPSRVLARARRPC